MKHFKNLYSVILSIFAVSVLTLFLSCTSPVDECSRAGHAAVQAFEYLIEGQYEDFVNAYYQPDSIPAGYHDFLVENAKMYYQQLLTERRGLEAVSFVSAQVDTTQHYATVRLLTAYRDSSREAIAVPMIRVGNIWKLR